MSKHIAGHMKQIREWAEAVGLAAVVLVILYFVFWPMRIDGTSMEDNYHSDDRIAISRLLLYTSESKRGDVVVCMMADQTTGKEIRVIKRVVGLPGEQVLVSEGKVFINGELLTEDYIKEDFTGGEINVTLNEDSLFIMGDNRAVSYDSRHIGPVDRKQLAGKVVTRFYKKNQ